MAHLCSHLIGQSKSCVCVCAWAQVNRQMPSLCMLGARELAFGNNSNSHRSRQNGLCWLYLLLWAISWIPGDFLKIMSMLAFQRCHSHPFICALIQQMFIELLLCVRYCAGACTGIKSNFSKSTPEEFIVHLGECRKWEEIITMQYQYM